MNFDITCEISELKNTILSCKAVSDSFFNEFVAGTPDKNMRAIQNDPEKHAYLYNAMAQLLRDAAQRAAAIEAQADAAYQQEQPA